MLNKLYARGKVFGREEPLPQQNKLGKKFVGSYRKYFPKAHVLQSVWCFSMTPNFSHFPANTYEFPLAVGPPELGKSPAPWKAKGLKPHASLLHWTPSHSMSHPSKGLVAACEASSVCL